MSLATTGSGSQTSGMFRLAGWLGSALVVTIFAGVILQQQEADYIAALNDAANLRKSELLLSASVEDIISEDRSRLETLVDQFHERDAQFYALQVTAEDGRSLLSWRRPNSPTSQEFLMIFNRTYPVQRSVVPIVLEGETYGRIAVEWDRSAGGVARDRRAYLLGGVVAVLCFAFVFVGYRVGRRHGANI